jgi:hypothetical protein
MQVHPVSPDIFRTKQAPARMPTRYDQIICSPSTFSLICAIPKLIGCDLEENCVSDIKPVADQFTQQSFQINELSIIESHFIYRME